LAQGSNDQVACQEGDGLPFGADADAEVTEAPAMKSSGSSSRSLKGSRGTPSAQMQERMA